MSDGSPPPAAIERITEAARRAPSAENCQPWTLEWDGRSLAVHHDAARAYKTSDPGWHASDLSLGCVLESIAVAADAEGFVAREELFLDDPRCEVWARVGFVPGSIGIAHLAPAIARRATDRRLFRGGTIDDPVFAALRQDGARHAGCGVHVIGRPSDALLDFFAGAEALVWRTDSIFEDVARWLRISPREIEESRDGASWRTMGLHPLVETGLEALDAAPLGLLRLRGARRALEALGAARAAGARLRRQVASSAALVLVTVRSERRADLVAAGRAAMIAWLHLTLADHGVQPHSQQSLFVYAEARGTLPPDVRPRDRALLKEGRSRLTAAFGLAPNELPALLLRTGRSPSLPEWARTLRREKA